MHSIPRHQPRTLYLVALVWMAGLAGCQSGPARGEVRGTVTFKGKPVTEGRISFVNPSGVDAGEAFLNPDGSYEIQGGLIVGEYVVTVAPLTHMVDTMPGKTPPSPEEKPAPNIPRKYRIQHTSPFKKTVEKGQNTFDFDMTP
jgi:hypothetical protein